MMMTEMEVSPEDFAVTASRAIAGCAGLSVREQAKHLAGDGLLGVMAGENVGGLGLSLDFAVPVVAAASTGLSGFPLLESILLGQLLEPRLPRVAEAIVSGAQCATIAWAGRVATERHRDGALLSGWVSRAPCAGDADWLLVQIGSAAAALVPVSASNVTIEDAAGLDIAVPEHSVRLDGVSVSADNLLSEGTWPLLQSDAAVLRAAAILGSAELCLELAQGHASTRRQFGHALSYNQAIRHALARHKLGLEGIRHAITRGLASEPGAVERDTAFLAAAGNGVAISEGALQIHGGMGFTWDVPIHRHLRRIRTLQAQGNASGLLAALGRRYIASVAPASDPKIA
jgi:alkylation response protein AidB-like acyl-CoA dehydrogenase